MLTKQRNKLLNMRPLTRDDSEVARLYKPVSLQFINYFINHANQQSF